ncbi:MAG: hypothetical protein QM811_30095 [Pirellulales bacterium]
MSGSYTLGPGKTVVFLVDGDAPGGKTQIERISLKDDALTLADDAGSVEFRLIDQLRGGEWTLESLTNDGQAETVPPNASPLTFPEPGAFSWTYDGDTRAGTYRLGPGSKVTFTADSKSNIRAMEMKNGAISLTLGEQVFTFRRKSETPVGGR